MLGEVATWVRVCFISLLTCVSPDPGKLSHVSAGSAGWAVRPHLPTGRLLQGPGHGAPDGRVVGDPPCLGQAPWSLECDGSSWPDQREKGGDGVHYLKLSALVDFCFREDLFWLWRMVIKEQIEIIGSLSWAVSQPFLIKVFDELFKKYRLDYSIFHLFL